jgi:hypothetical protein
MTNGTTTAPIAIRQIPESVSHVQYMSIRSSDESAIHEGASFSNDRTPPRETMDGAHAQHATKPTELSTVMALQYGMWLRTGVCMGAQIAIIP